MREASKCAEYEHYRVQADGGIILHQGRIAEMRTGEGKMLVSTCPAYLNALEGKGAYRNRQRLPYQNEMRSGWVKSMSFWD